MNKVRLSNYSDKETDIDCSHNEITTLILEGFYNFYLAMPIILVAAILWSLIIFQKVSSNLLLFSVTWAIASITLMSKWPKWEPKTLNQIIAEEQTGIILSGPHKSFK
jgi:hypothetical protein